MVQDRLRTEFALIRYVPDPVRGEFVNIGVVLRSEDKTGTRFTKDWTRVLCMDASVDVEMLEALEAELAARLQGSEGQDAKPVLATLQDCLSNSVQITEMSGALAESFPAQLEQLMRLYVDGAPEPKKKRKLAGRAALQGTIRNSFTRAGVWPLLRKRIAASEYTQAGDPLKIDCGYRNGKLRMFQAVSLENDAEAAKALAFSMEGLRSGVRRKEGVELELTAVTEGIAGIRDADQYRFGVETMQGAGLRVFTAADMDRAAQTARIELRV